MQHKRSSARPARTDALDLREQAVVLTFILDRDRESLTIPDLARTLNAAPDDFSRPDAVERAVRDLVGAGLAEIDSCCVQPTAAARRFVEIVESGV